MLGIVAVHRIHGDADRCAGLDHLIADRERSFERREDLARGRDHVLGMLGVRGQDGELVAAEASDRVGGAQYSAESRRDLLEQAVAAVVAQARR